MTSAHSKLKVPLAAGHIGLLLELGPLTCTQEALDTLPARQRDVVQARYGYDRPKEGLEEIAARLGVDTEMLQAISMLAAGRLKQYFEERGLISSDF